MKIDMTIQSLKELCPFYEKETSLCIYHNDAAMQIQAINKKEFKYCCDFSSYRWIVFDDTSSSSSSSSSSSTSTSNSCHSIGCGVIIKILLIWLTNNNKMYFLTLNDEFIRKATKRILEKLTEEDLVENENNRFQIIQNLLSTISNFDEKKEEIEKFRLACQYYED